MKKQNESVKGNLGCGSIILPGYVNVDNNPNSNPDVIHDLTKFPYPFEDDKFDEILLHHVLEHLSDVFPVLEEVFRITKNGGKIKIHVPHFSCNWFHPGHKTAFSTNLFYFFDHSRTDLHKEVYGKTNFRVIKCNVRWLTYLNENNIFIKLINNIITFLANKNLRFMERIWCYWVGGFEEIYFEVEVIK